MYWLDNNTGIPTAPTTPPVISASKRYFTNGGAGVQPSVPEDFWFNMVTDELLGVLDMAGIAPDKDDLGQLAKAIQAIAFSAYPVGAPIPWPTAVPPPGFLVMTGQSFSTTTYPKLALAYPSGVLPDLRAKFIRGWDNGKGVDVSRVLLSEQGDAGRNATGIINFHGGSPAGSGATPVKTGSGVFGTAGAVIQSNWVPAYNPQAGDTSTDLIDLNLSRQWPVAAEFRVQNTAFNYIVRAA